MASPVFQSMQQAKTPDFQSAMRQLRGNPAATLRQAGFNIPEGMNDPREIFQNLMQSGQIQPPMLQQLQQRLGMLRR